MTISGELREQVRQRANFACEFCGIKETDAGGELTIDHYQPKARGGSDNPENLLYCCPNCNQFKRDYWPTHPDDLMLWDPRREPTSAHFFELGDGRLHPLTAIGLFTLTQLRLNRAPLVAHRLQMRKQAEETRLLTQNQETVNFLRTVNIQLSTLTQEQRRLLDALYELLRLMIGRRE